MLGEKGSPIWDFDPVIFLFPKDYLTAGYLVLLNNIVLCPVVCRNIWIARNHKVFQGVSTSHQEILARSRACLAWSKPDLCIPNFTIITNWEPPGEGKVKFNVDGSFDARTNIRGCGGLARNHEGVVLGGFLYRPSLGSSLSTEIWSILWALKVAWDRGFRNVEVEGDCAEAVNAVIMGVGAEHPDSCAVHEAQMMLTREWVVDLHVCDREKNTAADVLAKFASTMQTDLYIFSEIPCQLDYVVKEDNGNGPRDARNITRS